ncbi:MAG: hypothetical protein BEN19_01235 [Epulopiscium sp. Nuni2H_MBin003]|nr:MAG: hypothetical protein BEN19_01235 [Epulopiscium sp. Nuni2H_MBin003]
MENQLFTIKDAAAFLDTEPYVLRYYEKELNLKILRNSKGHRVYSSDNLDMLNKITQLRDQGMELKALKNQIKDVGCDTLKSLEASVVPISTNSIVLKSERLEKFNSDHDGSEDIKKDAFLRLIKETIESSIRASQESIKEKYKDEVMALSYEATIEVRQEMVEYVDEKVNDLQQQVMATRVDEEHYRKLDETIREMQRLKREVAELNEKSPKNRKSMWDSFFPKKSAKPDEENSLSL